MGKQSRIVHEDVLQRINFLYQAAYQSVKSKPKEYSLCRLYISQMGSIAKKQCLHLHHEMKRRICMRCCVLLIPGHTCIVRAKGKRQKHTLVSCLECGARRRYVCKPGQQPWIDQPDAFEDRVINGVTVYQPDKQGQTGKAKKNQQQQNKKQISNSQENT